MHKIIQTRPQCWMSLNPTGTVKQEYFFKQEHTRKKYFTLSFTDFFEEYINYVIKHELLSGSAIDNWLFKK